MFQESKHRLTTCNTMRLLLWDSVIAASPLGTPYITFRFLRHHPRVYEQDPTLHSSLSAALTGFSWSADLSFSLFSDPLHLIAFSRSVRMGCE